MFSTPAVAGDLVLVGSCNGMIRALHRASGHVVWAYDTGYGAESSFHGDPLLVDKLFLTGTDGPSNDGILALERATGNLRWKAPVPSTGFDLRGVASDIQSLDGRIYATSIADEVMCLKLKDGSLLWSFRSEFRQQAWILNRSPAIAGGVVFFGGLDGTAYALTAAQGKLLWKQRLGDSILTSAAVLERGVVMGTTEGKLHLLDAKTGSVRRELDLNKKPSGPMLAADGKLLVCADWLEPSSELICVDDALSDVVWKLEPPENSAWSTPRPYVYGERVFLGNTAGTVFEYRLTDGQPVRQTHVGGVIRGVRLLDDVLYVGDQDGSVYAIQR